MSRWEPNARDRLEQAVLDLYTDPAARLAAVIGVISFTTAFAGWVSEPDEQDLLQLIREILDQLKVIIVGA